MGLMDSLKRFYFSIEDVYYGLADYFEDRLHLPVYEDFITPIEKKGIPSFLVLLLLFLLLMLGLYFLFLGSQQTGWTVVVTSNSRPLEGANVAIFDQKTLIIEEKTNANGIAFFYSLPQKMLLANASMRGFQPASREFDASKTRRLALDLPCLGSNCFTLYGSTTTTEIPQNNNENPLPRCTGNNCGLRFDNNDTSTSQYGKVLVLVRDANQLSVKNANVRLFDSNGNLIQKGIAQQGDFSADNIKFGTKAYAMVTANGFFPYNGQNNMVTVDKAIKAIFVTLISSNSSNKPEANITIINVTDSQGNALANATVNVFQLNYAIPLYQDLRTDSNGTLRLNLMNTDENGTQITYFASAQEKGYIDNYSGVFYSGANVSITLPTATAANSANLTVIVQDYDSSFLDGAGISVFENSSNGLFLLRSGITDPGKARFEALPRGITVEVNASSPTQARGASKWITMTNAENLLNIQISLGTAFLQIAAVDTDGKPINSSITTVTSQNATQSCSGFNCTIAVQAEVLISFTVNASGYFNYSSPTQYQLWVGEVREQQVQLVPVNSVNDAYINLIGVFDSNGVLRTALHPGFQYTAQVQLIASNAQYSGNYQRLDSVVSKIDGSRNAGWFVGHSPSGNLVETGSTSYALNCPNPQPINYSKVMPGYKWLNISKAQTIPSEQVLYEFNFTVNPNPPAYNNNGSGALLYLYRGFIIRNSQYYRNPYDPVLGTQESTPAKKGCDAITFQNIYPIPSVTMTCSSQACVSIPLMSQGNNKSQEGLQVFLPTQGDPVPVVINYKVEFMSDIASKRVVMHFSSQDGNLQAVQVTYPYAVNTANGWVNNASTSMEQGNFDLDLSDLSHRLDYHVPSPGWPYVISGTITANPISNTSNSTLDLGIEINSSTTHETWVSIIAPANSSNGTSGNNTNNTNNTLIQNSAIMSMHLQQRKADGSYVTDPFALYANGLCSINSIMNTYYQVGLPKCAASYLEFNYSAAVNETDDGYGYVFFNSTNSALQEITNLTISQNREGIIGLIPGLASNTYNGFFKIPLGSVSAGNMINVSFLATTVPTPTFTRFNFTFYNGKPNGFVNLSLLNALPGTNSNGTNATFGYFPCGKAAVTLDVAQDNQGAIILNSSCLSVVLQVDPIMPMDAIPVEFTQNFKDRCGADPLIQFNSPNDGSRDLTNKITFDNSGHLQRTAWIAFNAFSQGYLKDNSFDNDPNYPNLNILGKTTLTLSCPAVPNQFIHINIVAKSEDSRIPAVDGSYIYYEGQARQLIYSLYNGQVPQSIFVNASNEPTLKTERKRSFDPSNRVNYFLINHNSLPVKVTAEGVPYSKGVEISALNNRFGSVYTHMIAISHLDSATFNKYNDFLTAVKDYPSTIPYGIWNSTCPSIDYVSEVTHQIPYVFIEEAKRIALITGFRRSPPQNGYWCGHRKDRPPEEKTCYPTLLNWMQPGINETTKTISCPAPACTPLVELSPDPYSTDNIILSLNPTIPFPTPASTYGYNFTNTVGIIADMSALPASAKVTAAVLEYKDNRNQNCPISGSGWCSSTFLNGGNSLSNNNGVWSITYNGLTASQNGEYVVRVKATNETGNVFFYSPWVRVIVSNNAIDCFGIGSSNSPLCSEPTCDPFCRSDGTKDVVTNAGPDLSDFSSWWLNDSDLELDQAPVIQGVENYQGMPFNYFKNKGILPNSFTLSTPLLYWNWNLLGPGYPDNSLPHEVVFQQNGNLCYQGIGFYELSGSSQNGNVWNFGIALKNLPLSAYLLNTEPSDSMQLRNGYIDDIAPTQSNRIQVFATGYGCGIGSSYDSGNGNYPDVKPLCNSKTMILAQHTHGADYNIQQALDCFTACTYSNCGYCINFNLPFTQNNWAQCLPPQHRGEVTIFSNLQALSTSTASGWAYGIGQELGGCTAEAVRISN